MTDKLRSQQQFLLLKVIDLIITYSRLILVVMLVDPGNSNAWGSNDQSAGWLVADNIALVLAPLWEFFFDTLLEYVCAVRYRPLVIILELLNWFGTLRYQSGCCHVLWACAIVSIVLLNSHIMGVSHGLYVCGDLVLFQLFIGWVVHRPWPTVICKRRQIFLAQSKF